MRAPSTFRIFIIRFFMIVPALAGMSSDGRADKIYWAELSGQRVVRADLDGSNREWLVSTAGHQPMAVALDVPGGKMYWTLTGEVQRANLDGSAVESLVTGWPAAKGLALDSSAGKMYWTSDDPTPCIRRSNLDGTQIETVIEQDAQWLALDADGDTIYWTTAGAVHRADLYTRSEETLVEAAPGMAFEGIALDADYGKMYWVESAAQRIRWANLDGTGAADCITGLMAPIGVALDSYRGQICWTDAGSIHRAHRDCTNIEEDVIAGLSWPAGVALQIDCDNGVVDPGETCDIAIPVGSPGACVTSCGDPDACTVDMLINAGTCTAHCEFTPVTAPIDGDGCCPMGANADADNDNDCEAVCGNGLCETGEDADRCTPDCRVTTPTVSQWGLLTLTLLLLTAAKVRFARRHRAFPPG